MKCQDKGIAYVSPSSVYRVLKDNDLMPEQSYHQKNEADEIIETCKKEHQKQIERRKRLNRKAHSKAA